MVTFNGQFGTLYPSQPVDQRFGHTARAWVRVNSASWQFAVGGCSIRWMLRSQARLGLAAAVVTAGQAADAAGAAPWWPASMPSAPPCVLCCCCCATRTAFFADLIPAQLLTVGKCPCKNGAHWKLLEEGPASRKCMCLVAAAANCTSTRSRRSSGSCYESQHC